MQLCSCAAAARARTRARVCVWRGWGSTPNTGSRVVGSGAMVKCNADNAEKNGSSTVKGRRRPGLRERKWTRPKRSRQRGGEEDGPGRSSRVGPRNPRLKERVEVARPTKHGGGSG